MSAWTREELTRLALLLSEHKTINTALPLIAMRTGRSCDHRNTLASLLKRNGMPSPSVLLNGGGKRWANAQGSEELEIDIDLSGLCAEPPDLSSDPGYEFTNDDPDEVDLDELLHRRSKQFARKREVEELARTAVPVRIKLDGPIGVLHFGDPHVDDDGTDIDALGCHTKLVRETEGLFGGNVGDTTNNWVGRLARLYGQQSTSEREAWALCEWFIRSCPWLYIVGGNHDLWSGAGDPLRWISEQTGNIYKETSIRLGLQFPNGRECRLNIRHDFAGHSMYNSAHGSMKAALFGVKDHVLINGHKHTTGYGIVKDPETGIVSHCIQVASYKVYDRFAKEKGFRDQHVSPCAVTIVDPEASEASLVQVFHEPEEAAEYLTWKRGRRARGRSAA